MYIYLLIPNMVSSEDAEEGKLSRLSKHEKRKLKRQCISGANYDRIIPR